MRDSKMKRWIIVQVWRGIPSGVEVFSNETTAVMKLREIRATIKPEDEAEMFAITIEG